MKCKSIALVYFLTTTLIFSQNPCPNNSTVTYAGKTYNTVQIGNQCWIKENLDVGTMIQKTQTPSNNSTIEKYCYNDDVNNCAKYGGLYQWNEAMAYSNSPGTRGICPEGWRIPTSSDFSLLSTNVKNDGNTLKAIGQGSGAGAGTNAYGFSALLSGIIVIGVSNIGAYSELDKFSYFWSSSESTTTFAFNTYLMHSSGIITGTVPYNKNYGMSIRCVKDIQTTSGIPCPEAPTVTYGGKTYNTVKVGSQCWMKENLDIGTMVQGSQNQTNNGLIEKYCYDNNLNNCATYGGLYQWNEVMQYITTEGTKGICPTGWHIPTKSEFETLFATVSGSANALKAIGQAGGTNSSGFSVMLGGYRGNGFVIPLGGFGYLGHTDLWSSSQKSNDAAYSLYIQQTNDIVFEDRNFKDMGMSLRCLKDIGTDIHEEALHSIPNNFILNQNYPNPFNPSTNISYQIPYADYVQLKIYDELGRELITLVDEFKSAGMHSVKFSNISNNLPSGMYLYKLTSGKYSDVKKFILLK